MALLRGHNDNEIVIDCFDGDMLFFHWFSFFRYHVKQLILQIFHSIWWITKKRKRK